MKLSPSPARWKKITTSIRLVADNHTEAFAEFLSIIARLRAPDGCPWDREQTHSSLKPHMLQECYEVLDAIDQGDPEKLSEELGDLLLHIAMQAQIARDQGEFDMGDVLRKISAKLVYRHPHIFGDATLDTPQQVAESWESLKKKERNHDSVLASLPRSMPALALSQATQRRAAMVGFDWKRLDDVIDKLVEEVNELKEAADKPQREREFGDVLLALVNVARWMDIEAEDVLRTANDRFIRRFRYIEDSCRKQGREISSLSMEQLDALWEEAKAKLG